jgi:hypothetical protein
MVVKVAIAVTETDDITVKNCGEMCIPSNINSEIQGEKTHMETVHSGMDFTVPVLFMSDTL